MIPRAATRSAVRVSIYPVDGRVRRISTLMGKNPTRTQVPRSVCFCLSLCAYQSESMFLIFVAGSHGTRPPCSQCPPSPPGISWACCGLMMQLRNLSPRAKWIVMFKNRAHKIWRRFLEGGVSSTPALVLINCVFVGE